MRAASDRGYTVVILGTRLSIVILQKYNIAHDKLLTNYIMQSYHYNYDH